MAALSDAPKVGR